MFQVWTKAEYEDAWRLQECPDVAGVEEIIRSNFGKDNETKITIPVDYDARIAVKIHVPKDLPQEKPAPPAPELEKKQEGKVEAKKSETKSN